MLYEAISELIQNEGDLDLTLSIKFRSVSVELNINESLLVINTLAVKRAALRGGLWSTAGKRVEKPLMLTLCKVFQVPKANYSIKSRGTAQLADATFEREIDFYLNAVGSEYKCEVKLMGKGNPESADAVIARDSKVFVADKLSEMNIRQLDSLEVCWVELRSKNGFRRFEQILETLNIPHGEMIEPTEENLERILNEINS